MPSIFASKRGVYGEHTWTYALNKIKLEVDLHWNLINEPFFRKLASVEYWDLDWVWKEDGTGELTSSSRFIIAVVHAVYHHQFERLSLFADLQRAAHQISNYQSVRALARRTHTSLAVHVGLTIAAKYLNDPKLENIRGELLKGINTRPLDQETLNAFDANIYSLKSPSLIKLQNWLVEQAVRPEAGREISQNEISLY